MAASTFAFRRPEDTAHLDLMRAALSEFISTLIFVFASEGSALALDIGKMPNDTSPASNLVAVALAHALSLFVAVAIASDNWDGHVNPAVTFGALVSGRVSLFRSFFYWVAQILGAIVASLLLRIATAGLRPVGFSVASGIGVWNAVVLEIVMTFGLVYTVYATGSVTNKARTGILAPLAIGSIVGANILTGGRFDGASMNPARAFGPALVGRRWKNHWIYWVGPFVGAAIASGVYKIQQYSPRPDQPSAPQAY
ncbi:aquaporin TIP3-1-like [Magnolia sinica]|uniref:aquaporin TIP3-1-like n=1 Tax=Magnolia sinica TaxID=86752 RepID=UPI00265AFD8B|nr:aquaporin TIP3-1-like [Magnolia sinica]